MLSKSKQKYLFSLHRKKIRQNEGVFIAEGKKTIETLLQCNLEIIELFCLDDTAPFLKNYKGNCQIISSKELESISSYSNPDDGFAVVKIPETKFSKEINTESYILFLDQINDPGNMGTIIRLADWFGIKSILINKGNTDPYQPKSVQSSMGAIGNVKFYNVENSILGSLSEKFNIVSTKMDGENINDFNIPEKAVIVMGNEANGISDEVLSLSQEFVSIPKFPGSQSESLNVAMSCGILLSHFIKL